MNLIVDGVDYGDVPGNNESPNWKIILLIFILSSLLVIIAFKFA